MTHVYMYVYIYLYMCIHILFISMMYVSADLDS